jgi:sulfate/thiosulfate transport system ATP-binding protein
VTHDQEEALEVADRVVVMDRGRIQQAGTPQQVYDHPISPGVHEFIGESIIVPVTVEAGEVRFAGQSLGLDPQGVSGAALLFARPHDITIVPFSGENLLQGVVKRIHGIGPARRIEIALSSQQGETLVEVDALRSQQLHVGQSVGLRTEQYRLFPSGT